MTAKGAVRVLTRRGPGAFRANQSGWIVAAPGDALFDVVAMHATETYDGSAWVPIAGADPIQRDLFEGWIVGRRDGTTAMDFGSWVYDSKYEATCALRFGVPAFPAGFEVMRLAEVPRGLRFVFRGNPYNDQFPDPTDIEEMRFAGGGR